MDHETYENRRYREMIEESRREGRAMGTFALALIVVVVFGAVIGMCQATCSEAQAKTPQLKLSVGQVFVTAFPNGDVVHLPVKTKVGVGVFVPLGGWGWYTQAGMITSTTVFNPSPRILTGPSWLIAKKWILGATAIYQYNPVYDDGDDSHLVVTSGVIGVKVTDEFSVLVAVGLGRLLRDDAPDVWSLPIAVNLSFKLL